VGCLGSSFGIDTRLLLAHQQASGFLIATIPMDHYTRTNW
jgi:hypothetical protein